MKRANSLFLVIFIGIILQGFSQKNTSAEYAAKKWKLGVEMWTFHNFTLQEALAKTDSAGLKYIEIFPFQKSIASLKDSMISRLSPAGIEQLKQFLTKKNIKAGSFYSAGANTIAAWKKEFEMAKQFNMKFITAEPARKMYKSVDSLAGIYGIKVAIHNHWKEMSPASWHPDTLLAAIKNYPNLGACADVGHMPKSGVDPVEAIKKLKGHIIAVHLKDIAEKNNIKALDVPLGTGIVNFPEIFEELKRQKFEGYLYMERDANDKPSNLASVIQGVAYYNKTLGLPESKERKK